MRFWRPAISALVLGIAACGEQEPTPPPIAAASSGGGTVTVTAANPDSAPQDTTLDVHVLGGGFDRGSTAQLEQSGVISPNVKTNSTSYVSSSDLVANITIAISASTGSYDILVTTSKGKKGIGSELFTIKKKTVPPADPAIVYTTGTGHGPSSIPALGVMNADGSNQTVIFSSAAGAGSPSWAPFGDGTPTNPYAVAFQSNCQIMRIDVAVVNGVPQGSNFQTLPSSFSTCPQNPAWSPRGDSIAVSAGSPASLWLIPAGGGPGARSVYTPPAGSHVIWSAWSPDASRIAFIEQDESGPCCSYPRSIKVIVVQTGAVTTVLPGITTFPRFLDWARTKDALVFSAEVPRSESIYSLNLNPLGTPTLIVTGGAFPTWSPDDRKVAYGGISIVDLTTGVVTSLGGGGTWPDWRR